MGLRQICSEARKFFADLNQLDPAEPGHRLENKNSSTNIPKQTPRPKKSMQNSKMIQDDTRYLINPKSTPQNSKAFPMFLN